MSERVIFVSTGLGAGGAEHVLLRLTRRLTQEGTQCGVVSLGDAGVIGARLRQHSIPVWTLGLRKAASWPSAVSTLSHALQVLRPTVVQGWMYHGNLAATLATRAMRPAAALAWSVRQSITKPSFDRPTTRIAISLSAFLSRRANAIIYNSSAARLGHEAAGFSFKNGIVLTNGFDLDGERADPKLIEGVRVELQVPPTARLVGHVARWHPVKDHRTFLEAASHVIRRCNEAVFALVGDGVDNRNTELTQMVSTLGLQRQVRLLGLRTDVTRLQCAFDVACLSSRAESFPNAIGEAMCAGVPCASTEVGDVTELIGDTGRIVPVGNVDALGDALLDLILMEPSRRRELGDRARQRVVDHYSINSVAKQYAMLYDRLASAAVRSV